MKPNYLKTVLIGLTLFGTYAIWALYNVFVPLLLDQKFGLDARVIGFFMSLDNIAAFLIQPPIGAWSDRVRTPFGRRMPFILIGAPLAAVAFGLVPFASILPLFVLCTVTFMLSMAVWRTPAMALMPDITPSPFRSQASAIINLMGGVGVIIATLAGAALYERNPSLPFWAGGVLAVVPVLVVFFFVKEPKTYTQEAEQGPQTGMLDSLRELTQDRDKSGLRLMLTVFFLYMCFTGIESFLSLYAVNHLGFANADASRLMGQFGVMFVLGCLPSGFIAARIGRRPTMLAGIVLWGVAALAVVLLPASSLNVAFGRAGGLGPVTGFSFALMAFAIAWALGPVNGLAMAMDSTTTARVGTYVGLFYLFSSLASVVGPNVYGWSIDLTGQNYNSIMVLQTLFMLIAFGLMVGVRRGEVVAPAVAPASA